MATSVDAKLLKSTKFPPEFNQKVDMQKVNLEVMKRCVACPSVVHETNNRLPLDGLQARSPAYLAMRMMWL
jgi:hypothetical protein